MSQKKYFLLLNCVAFLLLFPLASQAAEKISIIFPQKSHFASQPIVFHIQPQEFVSPQKATVFYRAIGISVYRKLPLKKETPTDFRALLSAQKVVPPGIEYFFVVEDSLGRVFTFPETDPKQNPYTLKIELDKSPPQLLESTPADGAIIEEVRPTIIMKIRDAETMVDKNSVRLMLDGTDVTRLAAVTENSITYRPATALALGRHTITLDMVDIVGNRLPTQERIFSIPETVVTKKAAAEIQWHTEYRQRLYHDKGNT